MGEVFPLDRDPDHPAAGAGEANSEPVVYPQAMEAVRLPVCDITMLGALFWLTVLVVWVGSGVITALKGRIALGIILGPPLGLIWMLLGGLAAGVIWGITRPATNAQDPLAQLEPTMTGAVAGAALVLLGLLAVLVTLALSAPTPASWWANRARSGDRSPLSHGYRYGPHQDGDGPAGAPH